eukprot:Lithocolla_globosa_v1_NODE_4647_length_1394_cov_104.773712.p1 type:complete len:141 gc:universal NODE_4647_length_1394_cov_104.773712:1150-728(-)
MTPTEASKVSNQETVYQNLYGNDLNLDQVYQPKFSVGDYVIISVKKGLFEKEDTHKWSKERFIVREVKHTKPYTYILEDLSGELIQGGFYSQEMQKVSNQSDDIVEIEVLAKRSVKGQKQVKVKYKDDGKIAWVLESDIE